MLMSVINNSGIYRIIAPTGEYYIGSSNNVKKRWILHQSDLRNNKHVNPHMQHRYNLHPIGWVCEIIEFVSTDQLLVYEQRYIDEHFGKTCCMNCNPFATKPPSRSGSKLSEYAKQKLSKLYKNVPRSEEVKAKIRATKSKGITEETRAKLRAARARQELLLRPKP